MIKSSQCAFCTHFIQGFKCKAFPDGIPDKILDGYADHRLPYPGDHGVRMELKPGLPEGFLGPPLDSAMQKAS